MEADADLVAGPVQPLEQLHRRCRARAELLRQLVGRAALGLYAHENGDRARIDVERPHHARQLGDLVLVVDRDDADPVVLERETDVGLRLDRMHVEHLGVRRDCAHRRDLRRRGHVEDRDPRFRQRPEHQILAIGLDRIGGLARKQAHETQRVGLQHLGPEAIDGHIWSKRQRHILGIVESLHDFPGTASG